MGAFGTIDDVLARLLGNDLGTHSVASITSGGAGPWLRFVELHDDAATSSSPPPAVSGQLRFWRYQPDSTGTTGRMRWVAVAVTDGSDSLGQAQATWAPLPEVLPPLVGP